MLKNRIERENPDGEKYFAKEGDEIQILEYINERH